MTKMTYVEALSNALSLLDAQVGNGFDDFDLQATIEKLTALKTQTEKRNSADRKPTKNQIANQGLAERVKAVLMTADHPLTITEIMAEDDTLAVLSNQKVSAIVRSMGDAVIKTTEKRVSKFSLA